MLESIKIEAFRGILSGKLDQLTPLVVLVGPNGSGKTTLLQAMALGTNPVETMLGSLLPAMTRSRNSGSMPGVWARWLLPRGDWRGKAQIHVAAGGISHRCAFQLSSSGASDITISQEVANEGKQLALHRVPVPAGGGWWSAPAGQLETQFPAVRLVALDEPRLYKLFTEAVGRGQREILRELIREALPPAKDLEILAEEDEPVLHVVYADYSVPVHLVGDGVFQLVRLVLEMAVPPNSLVLIEEPESHQYSRTLRLTARAVWGAIRRGVQVVLTTHSLELLDDLLAEAGDGLEKLSLYRVLLRDGTLVHSRLPGPLVAAAREDIQEDLR